MSIIWVQSLPFSFGCTASEKEAINQALFDFFHYAKEHQRIDEFTQATREILSSGQGEIDIPSPADGLNLKVRPTSLNSWIFTFHAQGIVHTAFVSLSEKLNTTCHTIH